MIKRILYILLILSFATVGWGGTAYYCDLSVQHGTGGDGSWGNPFESIADINAASFSAGDDIYFKAGEDYTLDSTDNYLDFNWNGNGSGDSAVIGCYTAEGAFDCSSATLPILRGNLIGDSGTDVPTTNVGIIHNYENGNYSYITVQELDIRNTRGKGIYIGGGGPTYVYSHVLVTGNKINKYDGGAITLVRTTDSEISYNTVWDGPIDDNTTASISVNGGIVDGYPANGNQDDNIIKYNTVYQCRECIEAIKGATDTIIEYNKVYDPHDMCIYSDSAEGTIVRYNLCYQTSSWDSGSYSRDLGGYHNGIEIQIENARGRCYSDNAEIYGNFIAGMQTDEEFDPPRPGKGIVLACAYCENGHDECYDSMSAKIYNNTLVDNDYNFYFDWSASTSDPVIDVKNNISYHTANTGQYHTNVDTRRGMTANTNLFNQTDDAAPANTNSAYLGYGRVIGDPDFVRSSSFYDQTPGTFDQDDFKQDTQADANDVGTDLGGSPYYLDYWGTNKDTNTPWDIGAHEYEDTGTAYYVNCELSTGSNDGTSPSDAWQSIGDISGISDGDDIYFKAGTECTGSDVPTNGWSITFDGLSESNRSTIGAYYGSGTLGLGGNARPIINGTDTKPNVSTDGLIRAHAGGGYMHFKDLNVKNSLGAGISIKYVSGSSDYNIVENCYTQQTTYQGIVLARCSYSAVYDNIVEEASHDRFPGAGIEITGLNSETESVYNDIYRNTVYNCYEGIGIYQGSRYTDVYDNASYNNRSYHIYVANARGADVYNNLVYEGSSDHDSSSDYLVGIDCEDNQETIIKVVGDTNIYGNLISGGKRGIFIVNNCYDLATAHPTWGQSNVYVSNVDIYNNTIVDNEESFYFAHMDSASDINIANNISYLLTATYVHSTSYSPTGTTWSYNLFYGNSNPTGNAASGTGTVTGSNPYIDKTSGWQAASGLTGDEFEVTNASGGGIDAGTSIASYNDRISAADFTATLITVTTSDDSSDPDIGAWIYGEGEPAAGNLSGGLRLSGGVSQNN